MIVFNDSTGDESEDLSMLLTSIKSAFASGETVAVPESRLRFFSRSGICSPCCKAPYTGCYLFGGIKSRARRRSLLEAFVAFGLLCMLLPVFLIIALLIAVFDGLPILFRQERYGLDGACFKIFKFRTMIIDSEKLHGLMQHLFGKKGSLFKMRNDPRVTALGRLLRSSCLDELPQLFNVLKGEMRLCGPRPLPESDNHLHIADYHFLRLKGRPGITGLWQVSGRHNLTFDEMCLLDIYYLCNNNIRMDIAIILRTLAVLLSS